MAHDFNNLLMVIVSSLDLVRRLPTDDERHRRLLDNAAQAAQRGVVLTQRMLSFARQQDLTPAATDVLDLARGISDLLQRSIGPTVSLRIDDAELPPAHVDANQLELAIVNLVVNARDALPNGGVISISADVQATAPVDWKLGTGPFVRLAIADNGEGMDPETLARSTEPFFTTKGVGKGTGLGLSMVEGLARQSSGHLALKSRPGHGTTAELWLPVSADAIGAAGTNAVPTAAADPARRLTVLAVDDDALVLASTVALLEALGHTALGAASAEEAMVTLRQRPDIEVLLTDQAMPKMTGTELLQHARVERPGLAMILTTGYSDLKTGVPEAVLKLSKPFEIGALEDALARTVNH